MAYSEFTLAHVIDLWGCDDWHKLEVPDSGWVCGAGWPGRVLHQPDWSDSGNFNGTAAPVCGF